MPALKIFPVVLRAGRTTSVLVAEDDDTASTDELDGGEADLFLAVVGLDFPFLKKGTLISSVGDMVDRRQLQRARQKLRSKYGPWLSHLISKLELQYVCRLLDIR